MKILKFILITLIFSFNSFAYAADRTAEWNARENALLVVGQSMYDMVFQFNDAGKLKSYLKKYDLDIGDGRLIEGSVVSQISDELKAFHKCPGGTASNTAAGLVNLGKNATFVSVIGRDKIGHLYENELKNYGINTEFYFSDESGKDNGTGVVMVLLAPDGERTMLAYPGISKQRLSIVKLDETKLSSYKVIMSEGYLWDYPGNSEVITNMFKMAKKHGVHTAFTFGDRYVVEKYREQFIKLAAEIDLLFCNEREVLALFETDNLDDAVDELQKISSLAVVTLGERGALIITPEAIISSKAMEVKNIVDRTGAGDQYAAGFLYGYTNDYSLDKAGEVGAKNAAHILGQFGAKPKNKWAIAQ